MPEGSFHAEPGSFQELPGGEDRNARMSAKPQQVLVITDDEIRLTCDRAFKNALIVRIV